MKAVCCLALLSLALPTSAAGQDIKNIVLIAGLKSHGPEGNGIHDYAWSARLLQTMLENSNVAEHVRVTTHLNGWPSDDTSLRSADTIMIISDGRDGHLGREAPHLADKERIELLNGLTKAGCGVVTFHFSTFAPDQFGSAALNWYGGYFDWETNGQREWYSDITTIEATLAPATDDSEILRGVSPFRIREEFYFDIRFDPADAGWLPVWRVAELPATKPNGKVVAWAVDRADGHRGFATTCGHFYDNWQNENFRRTLLNAIAWTAHVPVPAAGVEADYFSREEIAQHLQQADLVAAPEADNTYADEPYWYQPGHPSNPANLSEVKTLDGFTASRLLTVPEELGSWTALCTDDRGRLLAAAQHRPGIHRITLPNGDQSEPRIETLGGAAANLGWSHGLLYAFDSLYVTVSEESDSREPGVYRLVDSDGDDQFDQIQRIVPFESTGEHGPHNIVLSPDGESLVMMCGNGTELPEKIVRTKPVSTEGIDHLMPPGFGSSNHTTAGFVCRFLPDGSEFEVLTSGLRNSFDLAFDDRGDLFTFDSDMEWDLGAPWYRPTRICHLVSGGEFGWRPDAAKWPEHFEDSVGPVLNIGPASPSGLTFGYGAKFPAKYQRALFACDWTFATIHAVHLKREGAGFRAEFEEFVGGRGLPVTDVVIGADGNMYFTVGGRRLGSAIYSVRYDGPLTTEPVEPRPSERGLHTLRRQLEQYHGQKNDQAVDAAWPHLGHPDRRIRFAARVAVETQPVETWSARALKETSPRTRLTALLALARQGTPKNLRTLITNLNSTSASDLPASDVRTALRVYELALARGGDQLNDQHAAVRAKLHDLFPVQESHVQGPLSEEMRKTIDRELSRLLCFLQDSAAIDTLLDAMENDDGQRPVLGSGYFVRNPKYGQAVEDMLQAAPLVDRMHHAQMLIWVQDGWSEKQRIRYFELLASATEQSRGGHSYLELWEQIREAALERLPESSRADFAAIGEQPLPTESDVPRPAGPGQPWTLNEVLELLGKEFRSRDFQNGEHTFTTAKCSSCHRFNGQGSNVGPDLTTIGQRFTLRDIVDSTLHPSKAVSDQYRVTMLMTMAGKTISGRIISRDATKLRIATNLLRPTQSIDIPLADIDEEIPVPISTMPTKLLDPLNGDEILDLLAYLISGGNPRHPVFEQ